MYGHCVASVRGDEFRHWIPNSECFVHFPSVTNPFAGLTKPLTLPNNKILRETKLKAIATIKIDVNQKLKFVLGRVENIVGKRENAGFQHFLLFPQCFQKVSFSGSLKVGIVGVLWLCKFE